MAINLRRTVAQISLSALSHNIRCLQVRVGSGQIFCPMVKANAYGHGSDLIANHLQNIGIKTLGVVLVEEALALRKAGIQTQILVFGVYNEEAIKECIENNLTPVLSEWNSLEIFNREVKKRNTKKFTVHIKFNTGMSRMGFDLQKAESISEYFKASDCALVLEGICTHLLNSEDLLESNGVSQLQIKLFKTEVEPFFEVFKPKIHYLNSGGILLDKEKRAGARPGISIYGLSPSSQFSSPIQLKPVMKWLTRLELIRDLKKNDTVSYGARWKANESATIGVLPVGYGDGYFRTLSNNSRVLIRGQECPVRGTVCMDYIMVDLSKIKDQVQVGDEVVLMGEQKNNLITAHELADLAQTICYEIVTRISYRVPRVVVEEENG